MTLVDDYRVNRNVGDVSNVREIQDWKRRIIREAIVQLSGERLVEGHF